jgi:hypothetical protein
VNSGYIVLGLVLIAMGAVQTWLRHGPWARQIEKAEKNGATQHAEGDGRGRLRSGRRWDAWTAVMGGVGIVFGLVLVVLGLTGS